MCSGARRITIVPGPRSLQSSQIQSLFSSTDSTAPPPFTQPASTSTAAADEEHSDFIRVCTLLFQLRRHPFVRLRRHLDRCRLELTPDYFCRVCNKFPYSWRPVYRFYQYTLAHPCFHHTTLTFNKMVEVFGRSGNVDVFCEALQEMGRRRLADDATLGIAVMTFARERDTGKCVEFLRFMRKCGYEITLDALNSLVAALCASKLHAEASFVVFKLRRRVRPCGRTYGLLIGGFCDAGDLLQATRLWNAAVDEGAEVEIGAAEKVVELILKKGRFDEALNFFRSLRLRRMRDLGFSPYRLLIRRLCLSNRVYQAHMVFDEMLKRGLRVHNETLASLIYGVMAGGRPREGRRILEGIERPSRAPYHALIRGLLRMKMKREVTGVFMEMVGKGCEPSVATYCLMLQASFGRRGRSRHGPEVSFETIFVGGLLRAGWWRQAGRFVGKELVSRGVSLPRFDYYGFLIRYKNEEGAAVFGEVARKLADLGLLDLAFIFQRYAERVATPREKQLESSPPPSTQV